MCVCVGVLQSTIALFGAWRDSSTRSAPHDDQMFILHAWFRSVSVLVSTIQYCTFVLNSQSHMIHTHFPISSADRVSSVRESWIRDYMRETPSTSTEASAAVRWRLSSTLAPHPLRSSSVVVAKLAIGASVNHNTSNVSVGVSRRVQIRILHPISRIVARKLPAVDRFNLSRKTTLRFMLRRAKCNSTVPATNRLQRYIAD